MKHVAWRKRRRKAYLKNPKGFHEKGAKKNTPEKKIVKKAPEKPGFISSMFKSMHSIFRARPQEARGKR